MIRLTSKETLRRSMIEIRAELSQNAAPKVADILAAKILLLREMRNAKIITIRNAKAKACLGASLSKLGKHKKIVKY